MFLTRAPNLWARRFLILILLLGSFVVGYAQSSPGSSTFQNQFPDPLQYEPPVVPPPELQLSIVSEMPIVGPIIGEPRWFQGRLELTTAAGIWSLDLNASEPLITAQEAASPIIEASRYALSASGNYRAEVIPGKRLRLQRRCRNCVPTKWRRAWKLRTAGIAAVPPLVNDRRVYFGSQDNRVFGVRRRNGHRVWASDIGGQAIRRLAWWQSTAVVKGQERGAAAVLAVPEPGAEMIVLDAAGGRQIIRYKLPGEEDRILGPVYSDEMGRIWVLRQGYRASDLSLIQIRLVEIESETGKKDETSEKGYNSPVSTLDTASETSRPVETPPDRSERPAD
jgi:hypothetical protein